MTTRIISLREFNGVVNVLRSNPRFLDLVELWMRRDNGYSLHDWLIQMTFHSNETVSGDEEIDLVGLSNASISLFNVVENQPGLEKVLEAFHRSHPDGIRMGSLLGELPLWYLRSEEIVLQGDKS